MPPNMEQRISRPWTRVAGALLAAALLATPFACSVLPAPGFPPYEEYEVQVFYDLSEHRPDGLRVPATGGDIKVLYLRADPPRPRETFVRGTRRLHPSGDRLDLHCRYRVYRRGSAARRSAHPRELFPGATSIRLVDRSVSGMDASR